MFCLVNILSGAYKVGVQYIKLDDSEVEKNSYKAEYAEVNNLDE